MPPLSTIPTSTTVMSLEAFTPAVQAVLATAQGNAESLQHDFVETEHLLGALLTSQDPGVQATLRNAGVPVADIEQELLNYLQPSVVQGQASPAFSVQVKQVLSAAVEEAQRALLAQAGPMHLLLGLVRVTDGRAAHALARFQVTTASLAPFRAQEPAPAAPMPSQAAVAAPMQPVPPSIPTIAQQAEQGTAPAPTPVDARAPASSPVTLAQPEATPAPGTQSEQQPAVSSTTPTPSTAGVLANFTTEATNVLSAAAKSTKEHKLMFMEPEEVLLAFAMGTDAGMLELLKGAAIDAQQLAGLLTAKIEVGTREMNAMAPTFSPRMKRVLEGADAEAKALNSLGVDPIHLFLALMRLQDGAIAEVCKQMNLTYDVVHAQAEHFTRRSALGLPGGSMGESVKESLLTKYGEDLTAKAKEGKLDAVLGRQHEIEQCVSILSRRLKNNPVIIGEAGVGKTALVEGLAQLIVSNGCPDILKGKRILQLNLTALISGASHRGEFEERMEGIIKEVKESNGEIILFIDEIHTLLGGGGGDGSMSAANILKPALSRGELRLIGATTTMEFKKSLEKDPALQRRFQKILLNPPSVELTVQLLSGLRPRYETYHHVKISDETLETASRLSDRYIQERFLPDKAVDLIDQASAEKHLPALSIPQDITDQEAKEARLRTEVETLNRIGAETRAKKKQRELDEATHRIVDLKQQLAEHETSTQNPSVTPDDIMRVISVMTGIPVSHLRESESEKLMHMEERLHERVVGQENAIHLMSEAVRRSKAGLKNPKQPIGSFIFLGPTGVGKTELAKTVAEFLFGSEQALIRFDMSEFQEKHAVARLIGAPPGYVGYDEGGQLTEAVRARPYSVVLFDELEKAHPDIFDLLLQLLDDGRLTDSQGRTVDFKNTIIICTSNIGARDIQAKLGTLDAPDALELEEEAKAEKEEGEKKDAAIVTDAAPTDASKDGATQPAAIVADPAPAAAPGTTTAPATPATPGDPAATPTPTPTEQGDGSSASVAPVVSSPFPEPTLPKLAPLPSGLQGGVLTPDAINDIQKTQEETKASDITPATPAVSPFPDATAPVVVTDTAATPTDATPAPGADAPAAPVADPSTPADPNAPVQPAATTAATTGEAAGVTPPVDAKDGATTGAPDGEKKDEVKKLTPAEEHRQRVLGELKKIVLDDLQKFMRPEMINRFDEVVIFEPLTLQHISSIVSLIVAGTQERLAEQGIYLEVEQPVKELLARQGFDPLFGARPLKRTCQRVLDNELSTRLIQGDFKTKDVIIATVVDNHVDFKKKDVPPPTTDGAAATPDGTKPTDGSTPTTDANAPKEGAVPAAEAPKDESAVKPVAEPNAPAADATVGTAPQPETPPVPAPAGQGLTFAPAALPAPTPTPGVAANQNPMFASELPPSVSPAPVEDLQIGGSFPSEAPPRTSAFQD